MKVEISDNVTLRVPNGEIPDQVAPVYLVGLPTDVMKMKALLEQLKV